MRHVAHIDESDHTHLFAPRVFATLCNTLQHTATHCNTLQRTTRHCKTLQHNATHCNALPWPLAPTRTCLGNGPLSAWAWRLLCNVPSRLNSSIRSSTIWRSRDIWIFNCVMVFFLVRTCATWQDGWFTQATWLIHLSDRRRFGVRVTSGFSTVWGSFFFSPEHVRHDWMIDSHRQHDSFIYQIVDELAFACHLQFQLCDGDFSLQNVYDMTHSSIRS